MDGFPYWSYVGNSWHRLLKLDIEVLPSNLHAGYFVEADGRIVIFSDYLTLFGFRKAQAPLSVISPLEKLNDSATAALKSVGGSGIGQLIYKTPTDSICSISETSIVRGISEGNWLISTLKMASDFFADTASKQISI